MSQQPSSWKIYEEVKAQKDFAEKHRHDLSWEIFHASTAPSCIAEMIMIDRKPREWFPDAKHLACSIPEPDVCE